VNQWWQTTRREPVLDNQNFASKNIGEEGTKNTKFLVLLICVFELNLYVYVEGFSS
jgi:hypothetical protein